MGRGIYLLDTSRGAFFDMTLERIPEISRPVGITDVKGVVNYLGNLATTLQDHMSLRPEDFQNLVAAPGAIGGTTPAAGAFTTIAASGNITPATLTASKPVFSDASKNLVSTGTQPVDQGGTSQTTYTDGQLLIGKTTGNTLAKASLTGTANQVTVTPGSGTITLSAPQDLAPASTPAFADIYLGGPMVDVRTYDTFILAIAGIGATKATLLIPNEQAVAANVAVPANVALKFLRGGSLNVANTKTVTISGYVDAGIYQIFKGTGTVAFVSITMQELYPNWWQENTTPGTTNMGPAMQAALTAGYHVKVPTGGVYYMGTTSLIMSKSYQVLSGSGLITQFLWDASFTGIGLDVTGEYPSIRNISILKPCQAAPPANTVIAMKFTGAHNHARLYEVQAQASGANTYNGWYDGVHVSTAHNMMINSCRFSAYARGGYFYRSNAMTIHQTVFSAQLTASLQITGGSGHSVAGCGLEGGALNNLYVEDAGVGGGNLSMCISGCYAEGATNAIVKLLGTTTRLLKAISINGNFWSGATAESVISLSYTDGISIVGNYLGASTTYGIRLGNTVNTNLHIAGNHNIAPVPFSPQGVWTSNFWKSFVIGATGAGITNGTTAGKAKTTATIYFIFGNVRSGKGATDDLWDLTGVSTGASEYKKVLLCITSGGVGAIVVGPVGASVSTSTMPVPTTNSVVPVGIVEIPPNYSGGSLSGYIFHDLIGRYDVGW